MEDELRTVLARYDLGELGNAQRIERGFVNENWFLETTRGRYFLKRRHPDLRNPKIIRAQHALMAHLRQAGFPAPTVLPAINGETLSILGDEFYEIQAYIEGIPYDHSRPVHFERAAAMLGCYHSCVEGFAPQALRGLNDLYSPTILSTHLANLTAAWELEREPEIAHLVRQLKAHAADLAIRFADHGSLPHLIIHGDYYAGNLLFDRPCSDDRIVGVVDYDKARWQPRVVELAEALIYFASPRPGHLKHLVYPGFLEWEPFQRFLDHYARIMPLKKNEARALPDYIRCIWLCVSLQRLSEMNSRPPKASETLREVLILGNWARANAQPMAERIFSKSWGM